MRDNPLNALMSGRLHITLFSGTNCNIQISSPETASRALLNDSPPSSQPIVKLKINGSAREDGDGRKTLGRPRGRNGEGEGELRNEREGAARGMKLKLNLPMSFNFIKYPSPAEDTPLLLLSSSSSPRDSFRPPSPTNADNCGVKSSSTAESEETVPQPEKPARKRKVVAKKPRRVTEREARIELPVTVGAEGCDGMAAVAQENVTPMVTDVNEVDDARISVKKDEGVVVMDLVDDDDTGSFELVLDDADMDASCDLLDNLSNMPPGVLV